MIFMFVTASQYLTETYRMENIFIYVFCAKINVFILANGSAVISYIFIFVSSFMCVYNL